MKLWSLSEEKKEVKAEPQAQAETQDRSEILRTKFIQKHFLKIKNLKNLVGDFPLPGQVYFLFTLKSFNAFTFIVYTIKNVGIIDCLSLSTYSLNERILNSIIKWYDKGQIKQINITISDSIRHRMPKVNDLLELYSADRNINITRAWNHSKITLIKVASHHFVIEGSGNFSENAMHEQYIWTNDPEVYDFRLSCITNT
ncbi:hypothetical protein [Roseivirga seohaensis]|uniref:hypothetical protein n=1 Tax=Roseivirga seohaensis TaxID=1914963 RepID=UPI003BAD3DC7